METLAVLAQLYCLTFASGPPDFYLSKSRQRLVCKSAPQVIKEARAVDIEPSLVLALITVESNWKRTAVSRANACGLTQVIPKYTGRITKKYSCDQLKVPRNSIYVGIKTLKFWINHHDGNVSRGLCGYNAGFRCRGKKPNKYGMRYARKVLATQKMIDKMTEQQRVN